MSVDTSIYNNQKLVEMPSMLDSQARAANLSSVVMNQARGMKQMSREEEEAQRANKQRQLMAFGGGIENVVNQPKEKWESAFNAEQENMIKSGLMGEKDRIPYSEQTLGTLYSRLNSNPEWLQIKKAQSELASSKNDPIDRDLDRQYKKSQIAKNYADSNKERQEKTPNQSQFAAATYGTRANQAENVFSELAQKGFDPTSTANSASRNLPGFLSGLQGEDVKRQGQAERNFVNSILRRESGAAISDGEFANASAQYFPRHGDTPEVIRQKEENRKVAIASLSAEGAPAMGSIAQNIRNMNTGSTVPAGKSGKSDLIQSAQADGAPDPKGKPDLKEIGGKKYVKVKGGWEEIE